MPYAPPRACSKCGRPAARNKPCECTPAWQNSTHPHDSAQMARLRTTKLRANPICEWPGCRRPAERVDHIVPLAEGGPRYQWSNLQSLCKTHDKAKTTADALRGKTRLR